MLDVVVDILETEGYHAVQVRTIAKKARIGLDTLYRLAWSLGLKTTYYLRSRSATHVEKSTLKGTDGKLNAVSSVALASTAPDLSTAVACSIDNPDCKACQ